MKRLRSIAERTILHQRMNRGGGGGRTPLVAPPPTPALELKSLDVGENVNPIHFEVGDAVVHIEASEGVDGAYIVVSYGPSSVVISVHDENLLVTLTQPGGATGPALRLINGTQLFTQILDPTDTPPLYSANVFCRVNEFVKTELCVQFHTGAIQILATEP